ncbi:hypothetical protein [Hoylesella shahii]|uniref:hypothetical protein n=1 Tax=Hoylesella shahii TaxID=228603 RepID=UPI001E37526D|nr:hypothetical protein [Hoylesella shahii]
MAIISKDNTLEWVAYLVIGYLGLGFLPGICLILLDNDFSSFIKFPLALLLRELPYTPSKSTWAGM